MDNNPAPDNNPEPTTPPPMPPAEPQSVEEPPQDIAQPNLPPAEAPAVEPASVPTLPPLDDEPAPVAPPAPAPVDDSPTVLPEPQFPVGDDLPSQPDQPEQVIVKQPSVINKKLVIIGGAIIGVLLIIACVFLVIIPALNPSKQDFATAAEVTRSAEEDVYNSTNNLQPYLSDAAYLTTTTINNDLDALKKAYQSYQDRISNLSELRAVKEDETAQDLYAKVVAKNELFSTDVNTVIELYEKVFTPLVGIDASSTANVAKIVPALQSIKGLQYDISRDFVESALESAQTLLAAYQAYDNATAAGDYSSGYYDSISNAQKVYSNNYTNLNSNLKKLLSDCDPIKELQELEKYLSERSY